MNKKFKSNLLLRFIKLLNVVLVTAVFIVCWRAYYGNGVTSILWLKGRLLVYLLYATLYIILSKTYDGFNVVLSHISDLIFSQVLALCISDFVIYIVICLLSARIVNVFPGILCLIAQIILCSIWVYVVHKLYFKINKPLPTAIIYDKDYSINSLINSYGLSKRFNVTKTIKIKDCKNNLSILDDIKSVFICDVHSSDRNIVLKYCIENDIDIYIIPRVGDVIVHGSSEVNMFHLPLYNASRYSGDPEYLIIKRFFDIFVSLLLLIITLPITLITAVCIKCNDGGPVLYKQVRLTKNGKKFNILKFRSMKVDAEKNGIRLSSGDNDERITSVGKVIRKYRIDELPQLLNILVGDLSLVGPRPERPEIAQKYCKTFPEFNLRLQVKAGLTGLAQVYGKYNTTPYNKLKFDLMYISNCNFINDLKIILATVKILFSSESTEGIKENNTTALEDE